MKYLLITLLCLLSTDKYQVNSQQRSRDESDAKGPPTSTTTTEPPSSESSEEYTTPRKIKQTPKVTYHEGKVATGANVTSDNTTATSNVTESTTTADYSDYSDTTITTTTTKRTRKVETDESNDEKERSDESWYLRFRDRHNLPEPFQLPGRKRLVDLENMQWCKCPRVYWPVCAKNGLTYLNYCVMDCLNQDIRRYGPCINYRRKGNKSGFLSEIGNTKK